jgi:hypothetical protein
LLVTERTYRGQLGCVCAHWAKRLTILAASHLAALSVAHATDYTITQIADDRLVNREPVISETGLAVWSAYAKGEGGEVSSDLYRYSGGERLALARSEGGLSRANMRPQVQSNHVVWVGVLGAQNLEPNWVLQEVASPERDQPTPELSAVYNLRLVGSSQAWEEVTATSSVEQLMPTPTNVPPAAGVTPTDGTETNAAPPPGPSDSQRALEQTIKKLSETNAPRRFASGDTEIMLWRGEKEPEPITVDNRDDLGPSIWGDLVSWQKAKGWPFGWEIMVWADGTQIQLTTNYYYDMAPKVQGSQVAWYGWDGHDFEIFLYDQGTKTTVQITSNQYDDVSPSLWDGVVVWEGYAGVDADVFMYRDGKTQKLSDNIEDDLNPKIWNGQVVWQGFDGDDFEIYLYDGEKSIKLTSNTYDDLNPEIRDGLVCWMGYYENWDGEVFIWDGTEAKRLTDNDYEDRDPKTAGGRLIWQAVQGEKSLIYLAEPK